jgi:Trypsin
MTYLRMMLSSAGISVAVLFLPLFGFATTAEGSNPTATYRENFGTSRQEAEKRLSIQRRGSNIVRQLEAVQGNRYAGVWFDNDLGEFVVPILREADRSAVAQIFKDANIAAVAYRVTSARSSWEKLKSVHEDVDISLARLLKTNLIQTSLDTRLNSVVIEVAKDATASDIDEIHKTVRRVGAKVLVRQTETGRFHVQPATCAFASCSTPLRGAVEIQSETSPGYTICSSGFKAEGSGHKYILTAGHCIYHGGTAWRAYDPVPKSMYPIGPAEQWNFPGNDWAKIRVDGYGEHWNVSPWPSLVAYWGVTEEYPIEAEGYSYEGQVVCHAGRTTGASCGYVSALDVTVTYPEGQVQHLTKFGPACIEGGDSGGPVFAGHVALGLVSGMTTTQSQCERSIFYPEITEATSALGVSVGPRTPLVIAVITANKELYVKTGGLSGEWVYEASGIQSVSVASDPSNGIVIGAITTSGSAIVKQGLYGQWVELASAAKAIDVATDSAHGPLIGLLTSTDQAFVKTGSLYGQWVNLESTAKAIDVATDSAHGPLIGLLTSKSGQAVVKTGSLYGQWVEVESAAIALKVATDATNGPLIGVLTTKTGQALVKSGSIYGQWVEVESVAKALDVATDPTTGPSIGVLTTKTGQALVKSGSIYGQWVEVESVASALDVASDQTNGLMIGVVTSGGTARVKRGNLFGKWVNQSNSITSLALAG